MKSWEREFEWHRPPCSPSFSVQLRLATTSISNQAHSHNHTSLASHQKSVIYRGPLFIYLFKYYQRIYSVTIYSLVLRNADGGGGVSDFLEKGFTKV